MTLYDTIDVIILFLILPIVLPFVVIVGGTMMGWIKW